METGNSNKNNKEIISIDFPQIKIINDLNKSIASNNIKALEVISDAANKMIKSYTVATSIDLSKMKHIFGPIQQFTQDYNALILSANKRNFTALTDVIENINKININTLKNSLENISEMRNIWEMNISPLIQTLNTYSSVIEKMDFSDVNLTEKDFEETIEIIEQQNIEELIDGELKKTSKIEGIPAYIKKFIYIIILVISHLSDSITLYEFVDEKVYPLEELFFENRNAGMFENEKSGLNWLNNELKADVEQDIIKNFRIVAKDDLIIRLNNNKNSRITGKLNAGNVVQIIEKRRNWTYIIYSNIESDEVIEGWTYTRYLTLIK